MLNKKVMMLVILVVSFLTVSAVSASNNATGDVVGISDNDVHNTVVSYENGGVLEVKEQDIEEIGVSEKDCSLTSDGTYQDLQKEINNAGDVLNLTKNYTFSYNFNGIKISKKITINGNGFTIDLKDSNGFIINSNDVVLNNILFINPSSTDNGSAIYWSGDNGIISNCSFIRCHSYGESSCGGAVYWGGNNGTITDCSFINCSTYNGQMDDNNHFSKGGAIFWTGENGTLINSIFSGCYVHLQDSGTYHKGDYYGYGGAVYWAGKNGVLSNFSVNDCHIYHDVPYYRKHNPLYSYGGAVYWEGENGKLCDGTFINCNANANSAHYPNLYSKGGAVYWAGSFGDLNNCSFLNCTANSILNHEFTAVEAHDNYFLYCYSYGGAVYWEGTHGILNNSKFNKCISNASYDSLYTHMYISQFDNTYAIYRYGYSYGGAVYWEGENGKITNCSFIDSTVDSSSFSYYEFTSESSTKSRNFNYMYSYGGAVYWAGKNGMINNSSFIHCNAVSISKISSNRNLNYDASASFFVSCIGSFSSYASAVYWMGSNGILENNIFKECYSSSNSDYINAMCTRNGYGGAVYWEGENGKLIMSNFNKCGVKVKSNSNYQPSYGYGGAVYWKGNNGKLSHSIVSDCYAYSKNTASYSTSSSDENSWGGAIYWEGYGGNIDESSFIRCTVNHGYGICYNGGAIYWKGNFGILSNSIFINNTENDRYNGTLTWVGNKGKFYNFTINGYKHIYNNHVRISNDKLNPGLNVFIANVYLNETTVIIPSIQLNALGNMSFSVYGGEEYNILLYEFSNIEYNGNIFNLNLSNISVGKYKLISKYFGDSIFEQSSYACYFNVFGYGANIKISVENNIVAGDDVLFNITFDENVSGIVTILINDKVYSSNLNNSEASILVPKIYGGINNYVVKYSGDEKYNSLEITKTLIASFLNTTIQFEFENSSFGNIIINPIISKGATGYIDLYVDDILKKRISVGDNFALKDIDAGNHTFKVIYSGDNFHDKCDNVSISEVFKANPTFDININNINYKESTTVYGTFSQDINGYVNITISNNNGVTFKITNIVINNGVFNQELNNLNASHYTITFEYAGNENYNHTKLTKTFSVFKIDPSLDIDVINAIYGQPAKIIVNSNAEGNVTINVGSVKTYDEVSIRDMIIQDVTDINAGNYSIKVTYNGNNNYNAKTFNSELIINKASANVVATVDNITYSEMPTINIKSTVDGIIVVKIDNDYIKNINIVSNIIAPVVFEDKFPVGKHNVTIVLKSSNNYNESIFTTDFTVSKKQTSIILSVENSVYGEDVIVNVTASEYGKVVITVGDITHERSVLANTQTKFNFGILAADSYDVSVCFDAGDNYKSSQSEGDIIVSPAEAQIIEIQPTNNVYGENTIIKVKTSVASSLIVKVDSAEKTFNVDANKLTSLDLGILDAGLQNIKVTLNAGSNYTQPTRTTEVTIAPKFTTVNVNGKDSVYGENIIVNVSASENGKIAINVGDNTKYVDVEANKLTSVDLGILNARPYTVNVTFDAGSNYVYSKDVTTISIAPKNTVVTLNVKDYNADEHVLVKVTASENGKATVKIGDIVKNADVIANKYTSIDFGVLNSGSYVVVANFTAGSNYVGSSDSAIIKVLAKIDEKDINISVPEIKPNQKNNIVINLPADAIGTVTLTIGNNSYTFDVKNGVANVNVPKLDEGNYDYVINYSGDNKYSSFENSGHIDVKKPTPEIVVPPLDKPSADGSVTINLPSDAKGTITLGIGGKPYSFPVINGVANVYMPDLANGDYNYTITYSGDGKYSAFTNVGSVKINKIIPTVLTTSGVTTVYNSGGYLLISLKDANGKSINGVQLSVVLNGKNYAPITDENGQAKVTTNGLTPKDYVTKITFDGNNKYAKSSMVTKVTVKKATPKLTAKAKSFKRTVKTKKYTVTLKTNQNKVMKNTKVTLKVNKVTYTAKTNAKGQATFKITKLAKKGRYTAIVKFSGNKYYNAKTVKPKITVK